VARRSSPAGKPLVAIISMDRYRMLEQDKAAALEAVNAIWEKMKGEDPKVVERTVDEAVRAVRKRRT
jgi:hypothetical protein